MGKRAQVAVEFLTTYGWVIVGVIILITVLLYYGMFDPLRFIARQCSFEPGLPCTTYKLESTATGSLFIVQLSNNLGYDISLPNGSLMLNLENVGKPGKNTYIGNCSPMLPAIIKKGQTFTCIVNITDRNVTPSLGKNIRLQPQLSYKNCLTDPKYLMTANCTNATTYTSSGTTVTPMEPYTPILYCGDGICSPQVGETPAACPADCPPPATIILNAVPSSVVPDGSTQSQITATVTDTKGNPVPNMSVIFSSMPFGDLSSVSTLTLANGVATVYITSNQAGPTTVMGIASTVYNTTNVSFIGSSQDCGTINQSTKLHANLTSTGNCINFGNGSITLDCNGNSIFGVGPGTQDAISAYQWSPIPWTNNITIQNCKLVNWDTGMTIQVNNVTVVNVTITNSRVGILSETSNSLFENVTVNTSWTGILEFGGNNVLTNLSLNGNVFGLSLFNVHNDTITNSTFNSDSESINIFGGSYNRFSNLNFTDSGGNIYSGPLPYYTYPRCAVGIGASSHHNIFTDLYSDNVPCGAMLLNTFSNLIANSTFSGAYYWGIFMGYESPNVGNNLTNIVISDVSRGYGPGLWLDEVANNVTVTNLTVDGARCSIIYGGSNVTITNSRFIHNAPGIYISNITNLVLYNNTFNNTSNVIFDSVIVNDINYSSTYTVSSPVIYPVTWNTSSGGNYWSIPPHCEGTPKPCSTFLDQTSCEKQLNCHWWSGSDWNKYVSSQCYEYGLQVAPCGYFLDSTACNNQQGCDWNSTPSGYSDTCTVNAGFCKTPWDVFNNTNCTGGTCSNNTDWMPIGHS
jgi:hypothetical protein